MRPEILPRSDRPEYVRLACPNRPWGRPRTDPDKKMERGCSGGTQFLRLDSAIAAWARLQAGRQALAPRSASVLLSDKRCRCGLRLPCDHCIDVMDFARTGLASTGALP
jgi:hypothetical protein